MHDDVAPRAIYLREWAAICRVPFSWLAGDAADTDQGSSRNTDEFSTLLAA
jgi:hypothetical protein